MTKRTEIMSHEMTKQRLEEIRKLLEGHAPYGGNGCLICELFNAVERLLESSKAQAP